MVGRRVCRCAPHLRVVRKVPCVPVAVEDTPQNIVERITFYAVDSKRLVRCLPSTQKRPHLREIAKDITYFKTSYRRANIHANIAGLGVEPAFHSGGNTRYRGNARWD